MYWKVGLWLCNFKKIFFLKLDQKCIFKLKLIGIFFIFLFSKNRYLVKTIFPLFRTKVSHNNNTRQKFHQMLYLILRIHIFKTHFEIVLLWFIQNARF